MTVADVLDVYILRDDHVNEKKLRAMIGIFSRHDERGETGAYAMESTEFFEAVGIIFKKLVTPVTPPRLDS